MLFPYISYLKFGRNLEENYQKITNQNQKKQNPIQRYLAEISSFIGTLEAIALTYNYNKAAIICVLLNTLLNTTDSILKINNIFNQKK